MNALNKDHFIRNEREQRYAMLADELAQAFAKHAAQHDRDNSFPYENFALMKQSGYLKMMLPEQYGGEEASLYELIITQERLARGDGSTALAVGWHTGIMLSLRVNRTWPEDVYAAFCQEVVENGEMLNSFASEPRSGSPSRGGKPETVARWTDNGSDDTVGNGHEGSHRGANQAKRGWLITGHKNFSTLSPILNYFIISATIEDDDSVGRFLVRRSDRIRIEETWDSLGMRATGSHDLIMEEAFVPEGWLVEHDAGGAKPHTAQDQGWLLHIPACYIGIAHAARDFAITYAKEYQPASLTHPIAELPHIQHKIGLMEADLRTARTLLYTTADRWDQYPDKRYQMRADLGLAKVVATNTAISIVDQAMRIVGGASLSKRLPLERMYRDVRAGLHNPPMDDAVINALAQAALHDNP